jgi:hypothetical protein
VTVAPRRGRRLRCDGSTGASPDASLPLLEAVGIHKHLGRVAAPTLITIISGVYMP